MGHVGKAKQQPPPRGWTAWVVIALALGVSVWAIGTGVRDVRPPPAPGAAKAAEAKAAAGDADLGPVLDYLRRYDGQKKRPLWTRQVSIKEEEYRDRNGKLKSAYTDKARPDLTVETLPPRRFAIINNHEHVRDEVEALRLIKYMDEFGIERVALMGTSIYTLTLNDKYGFEQYKENNEEIIRLANKYPKRLIAFPTIFPPETGNLELLQDYARRGAQGLKLYMGHGAKTGKEEFHMMPLDDERMKPIYAWAQETQFPLAFHINFTKYYAEFVRVMEQFPYLRVAVPHFGLFKNNKRRLDRLSWLLDRYPNFYTDVGFGFYKFQIEGYEKMGSWPSRFRAFFRKHGDRVMYSTDMVLEPLKDEEYIRLTLISYMQMLEMDYFRFFYRPRYPMRGLALPDDVLRNVYEVGPKRYLLIDDAGRVPDRSGGWPPAGWKGDPPGVPPAVKTVEPLPPESPFWSFP